MRILALLFLVALPVQSQQFGDDNESGKWLPIPDGYVWPLLAEGAPEFKPSWKRVDELDAAQRKAVEVYRTREKPPEQVEIAEVDLNADGRPELFVRIPAFGGTGGTFYEILSAKDGRTYTSVGGLQGWGIRFRIPKNGWLQIEGMSRGGGGNYTRYLMAYADEGYAIVRNEGHDFNADKVTIRKTPTE